MDAGKLNKHITIQRRSKSKTPAGQPVETWSTLCAVWAQMKCKNAAAVSSDGMTHHEGVYHFYIRYRSDIKAGDRVSYQGRIFELTGPPADWEGEKVGLTLITRELV